MSASPPVGVWKGKVAWRRGLICLRYVSPLGEAYYIVRNYEVKDD